MKLRRELRNGSLKLLLTGVLLAAIPMLSACSPAMQQAGSVAALNVSATTYHVARTFQLGGEGFWDYLYADPVQHRLYISRGTHVVVWDTKAEKVIGDIPNTPGVHGVAVAHDFNRGFTSNGRDSSVTIFDLTTLATVGVVHGTGANPDAITYDPLSKRVFTFNGRSNSSTAIDAASGTIVGTVALGGKPETAQPDGEGNILVNIEDKSNVVKFDARSLAVAATWPLAPCEEPSGMDADIAHHRLIIGCGNKLMAIMDSNTGRVVATIPAGAGIDASGYDPRTGLAFTSNGEGTLTVVRQDSPDAYSLVATVPTKARARTMAVDPTTGRVYTVTAEFGPVPAPTATNPRPRPAMIPGSFTLLVLER